MVTKRIVVCGFGRVGQAFVELLAERGDEIEGRYGLRLALAASVDIGGAAVAVDGGLPAAEILAHVRGGGPVVSQ